MPGVRSGPLIALALLSAALVGVLFLLVLLLDHRLVGRAAGRRRGGDGAADRGGRSPRACAARHARERPRARCSWPAACWPSPSCPAPRCGGPSCRRRWPAPASASRCPPSPASCCPRTPPSRRPTCSRSATPASPSRSILLAPVAAAQLDDAVADTRIKGAALVLDARLPPLEKLSLAGTLLADIDPVDPRGQLEAGLAARRRRPRGPRRLRRARHARGRDARGGRPGRLRAGLRDLRRARAAGRAGAAPARRPRARRGRRGRRAGRRRRARPAGARARAGHARRPVRAP